MDIATHNPPPISPPVQLRLAVNPIFESETVDAVDLDKLDGVPTIVDRPKSARREIRDLRRKASAADAIRGLDHEREIYGFTKGQFSLLELLAAVLETTGPVHFSLSTWTAVRHEIQALDALKADGKLLSMRWLCDFTFTRRDPEAAHQVRTTFGADAIRVAQVHAKFALFDNPRWKLVLRTSMNLNMNPRFEDFTIAHDPPLFDFLQTLLNEIWKRQTRTLATSDPGTIRRHFRRSL